MKKSFASFLRRWSAARLAQDEIPMHVLVHRKVPHARDCDCAGDGIAKLAGLKVERGRARPNLNVASCRSRKKQDHTNRTSYNAVIPSTSTPISASS